MNNRHMPDSAIESRLAVRIAGGLTAGTESLPHDVAERLRHARTRAVQRAVELRLKAPAGAVWAGTTAGGAGLLAGFMPWWQRAAAIFPLILLVFGLLVIDRWSTREQVLAAAEIDAQLLSDNLPPAAYSDPGFAEYLRTAPAP